MKTLLKELWIPFAGLVLIIWIVLWLQVSENIAHWAYFAWGISGPAPVTLLSWHLYTGESYTGWVPNNARWQAYVFAKDNGYATTDAYAGASFDKTMTRADVANIVVWYYKNVVNEDIERSYRCNPKFYRDFNSMNEQEQSDVWDICSLWAMGWQSDRSHILWYFRPNDRITKAEFSTMLSRLMYGTESGTGATDNRYTGHMEVLMKQSVIADTKNPNGSIQGWDVFQMLMNVAK